MFAKLRNSKEALLRQFAGQFDIYQNQLVYRRMSKGPPIRVSEEERDRFIADFDINVIRLFWVMFFAIIFLAAGLIVLDETNTIAMPDWVPIPAIMTLIFVGIYFIRRALIAPAAVLSQRAAMGGERSTAELKQVYLRQMIWPHVFVPLPLGLAAAAFAILARPQFHSEHPYISGAIILFAAYMIVGGSITIYQKWRAEREI
jgi:uncharacterized membrane protein YozB (DUF420 family)